MDIEEIVGCRKKWTLKRLLATGKKKVELFCSEVNQLLITFRGETFAGRNFRNFHEIWRNLLNFDPWKIFLQKFAEVNPREMNFKGQLDEN